VACYFRGGWLRGGDLNPGPLGYDGNSTRDQQQLTPTKPNKIAASGGIATIDDGSTGRRTAMLAGPTPLGPSAYGKDSNSRRHFVECDDGALLERLAMRPQRSDDIVPNGGRKHGLGSYVDDTGAAGSRRGYER
jgi:hypothetical protein